MSLEAPTSKRIRLSDVNASSVRQEFIDFDKNQVCSVTLSKENVYCCLACGIFFQGRSQNSPAMKHCFDENHNLFIKLDDGQCYDLSSNRVVTNATMQHIKDALIRPVEPISSTKNLLYSERYPDCHRLSSIGEEFIPGVVGLHPLRLPPTPPGSEIFNATLQLLLRVLPIRHSALSVPHESLTPSLCGREVCPMFASLVSLIKRTTNPHAGRAVASAQAVAAAIFGHPRPGVPTLREVYLDPALLVSSIACGPLGKKLRSELHGAVDGSLVSVLDVHEETGARREVKTAILPLDLPPPPVFKENNPLHAAASKSANQTTISASIANLLAARLGSPRRNTGGDGKLAVTMLKKAAPYITISLKRFATSAIASMIAANSGANDSAASAPLPVSVANETRVELDSSLLVDMTPYILSPPAGSSCLYRAAAVVEWSPKEGGAGGDWTVYVSRPVMAAEDSPDAISIVPEDMGRCELEWFAIRDRDVKKVELERVMSTMACLILLEKVQAQ